MSSELTPTCTAITRPPRLFDPASTVHGLRVARTSLVGPDRFVEVWLFRDPPPALADPTLWTLRPPPGASPVDITSAAIDADHVRLGVSGAPGPTRYRLEITPPAGVAMDPLRLRLPVGLRPECPDLGNCFPAESPTRAPGRSPVHDYTARDWSALRRALLEFHRQRHPDADTSVADPAVAVLELFAHLGDLLHYRLDRVSTEAYLATARRHTSVRRHARLLDYHVGDAVAARTTVHVSVPPGAGTVAVREHDRVRPDVGSDLAFSLEGDLDAVDALGEIAIYDWGESGCRLPVGATSAVLVRPVAADPLGSDWLSSGDQIVFEVVDPGDLSVHDRWRTRDPAVPWPQVDGDDAFRPPLPSRAAQVVRITWTEALVDPLAPDLPLTHVRWSPVVALRRDYPVSPDSSRGATEVTVARGNLVAAHHGVLVSGESQDTLEAQHADWADGLPPAARRDDAALGYLLVGAAGGGLARRADGTPYRLDVGVRLPSGGTLTPPVVLSHLGSTDGQLRVTVEEEPWRRPLLRFRTGEQGTTPPPGSTVTATYEVGGGARAMVPANSLVRMERNAATAAHPPTYVAVPGIQPRNPVPATGGADPETTQHVRLAAPQAFAVATARALLPADHAAAALDVAGVDRASSTRQWTGAWPLVSTAIDPAGAGPRAAVASRLEARRMIGQEVAVVPGRSVALVIGLEVCLRPGTDAEATRRAILARLRPGTDATPGLFHPANMHLGARIHVSTVVAAVAAVDGTDAVEVTEARRLSEPVGTVHNVLVFDRDEVAVLDDDAARPDRGRLQITLRGGR